MLRKLLTLFALLSGLAAIGAPATARAMDLSGVGVVASAELNAKCAQTPGKRGEDRKRPAAESGTDKKPCRKAPSIVYFPPVMLQADRARE
jgi:hypothetical protein